jgi:hypothetical protein
MALSVREVFIDGRCCMEGRWFNTCLSGGSLLLLFVGGGTGRDILVGEGRLSWNKILGPEARMDILIVEALIST